MMMIFNMPELSICSEHGQAGDEKAVTVLFQEIGIPYKAVDVRCPRGSRRGSGDRAAASVKDAARPMKISFANEINRDNTLKAFHKHRKENNSLSETHCSHLWFVVSMRKDVTPLKDTKRVDSTRSLKTGGIPSVGGITAKWIRRSRKIIDNGIYLIAASINGILQTISSSAKQVIQKHFQ